MRDKLKPVFSTKQSTLYIRNLWNKFNIYQGMSFEELREVCERLLSSKITCTTATEIVLMRFVGGKEKIVCKIHALPDKYHRWEFLYKYAEKRQTNILKSFFQKNLSRISGD